MTDTSFEGLLDAINAKENTLADAGEPPSITPELLLSAFRALGEQETKARVCVQAPGYFERQRSRLLESAEDMLPCGFCGGAFVKSNGEVHHYA